MRRRVGRPSLLGTAARTAVIAGTATAVSGNVAQKQAAQQQAAQQQAAQQQAAALQADAARAQAEAVGGNDLMAQLQQLASMHQAGILTDAEFTAAKTKLLA